MSGTFRMSIFYGKHFMVDDFILAESEMLSTNIDKEV
jgi:hypothetical protein